MWQFVVCPGDPANKQHGGEKRRTRGREKEQCASQMVAAQPTCKLNQLRSMRKWLALRKNNLGASKETVSLMRNRKLGHQKSRSVYVYACVYMWKCVWGLLKWLLNKETKCSTLQSRWKHSKRKEILKRGQNEEKDWQKSDLGREDVVIREKNVNLVKLKYYWRDGCVWSFYVTSEYRLWIHVQLVCIMVHSQVWAGMPGWSPEWSTGGVVSWTKRGGESQQTPWSGQICQPDLPESQWYPPGKTNFGQSHQGKCCVLLFQTRFKALCCYFIERTDKIWLQRKKNKDTTIKDVFFCIRMEIISTLWQGIQLSLGWNKFCQR